jgi:hypothetical protein
MNEQTQTEVAGTEAAVTVAAVAAPKEQIAIISGISFVKAKRRVLTPRASKYRWDEINEIGTGFHVPDGVGEKGFRTLAQKAGAARGKIFSVGHTASGQLACILVGFRQVDPVAVAEEAANEAEHKTASTDDLAGGSDSEGGDTDMTAETAETAGY